MTETPAPSNASDLTACSPAPPSSTAPCTQSSATRSTSTAVVTCSPRVPAAWPSNTADSIAVLVDMDNVASAIVLLRAQFEAIVRALWLHDVATDDWIERYFEAVKANPLKDPNFSNRCTRCCRHSPTRGTHRPHAC